MLPTENKDLEKPIKKKFSKEKNDTKNTERYSSFFKGRTQRSLPCPGKRKLKKSHATFANVPEISD